MKKQIRNLLYVLAFVVGLITLSAKPSFATAYQYHFSPTPETEGIIARIQQIMKAVPDKTFFTVNGKSSGDSEVNAVIKSNSKYKELVSLDKLSTSWTCIGFTRFLAAALYGTDKYGDSNNYDCDIKDPVPGDFFYTEWYNSDGKKCMHAGLFLGWCETDSSYFYVYDSNGNSGAYYNNNDNSNKPTWGSSQFYTYSSSQVRVGVYNKTKGQVKFYHHKNYAKFNSDYKSLCCYHNNSSYKSIGYCPDCDTYFRDKDPNYKAYYEAYSAPVVYKLKYAAKLRRGPYEECTAPEGKSLAGTTITVVGKMYNGRNSKDGTKHYWYVTDTGRYIYSNNVEYVGPLVTVADCTVSKVTDKNVSLSTTITKPSGMVGQEYGIYIINWDSIGFEDFLPVYEQYDFHAKDPNGTTLKNRTSYSLTMDLVADKTGIELKPNTEYWCCLYVVVDGYKYESNFVKVNTGISGSTDGYASIVSPEELANNESAVLHMNNMLNVVGSDTSNTQAITWNTPSVTGVTSNTATVKYTLTPNKSLISRIGLEYCTDGQSYTKVPGCEWAGYTLTNFCSVAFNGSEGPKLNPGTTYYCRFYITRTDGGKEYSKTITFTTTSVSSETKACNWLTPTISNVTNTTAFVKYTLTPDKSRISRIGLQYSTDNVNFVKVPGCEWAGSTLTNFCSVSFDGKEGPLLNPGTNYYCRFYVIRTDGVYEYSNTLEFKTTGTSTATVTTCIVGFNGNGADSAVSQRSYTVGAAYGSLPVPTQNGYTFDGWYTSLSGGSLVTASNICSGATTLYAHWTPVVQTVTVTYHYDDQTYTQVYSTGSSYGDIPAMWYPGYTFDGWYTGVNGSGRKITESTMVDASVTNLYDNWTANTYTMYLDPNGGTCSVQYLDYVFDGHISSYPTPVRAGYTFAGWYTERNGGAKVAEATRLNSEDLVLYARWVLSGKSIQLTIGSPYIVINGQSQLIDDNKTAPVIRDSRTLLPIKALIEAMGGKVEWNGSLKMVTLTVGTKKLYLMIDKRSAVDQDYNAYTLDTAPVIINGRTMLPVKFIAEFFGASVSWDANTRTVGITY